MAARAWIVPIVAAVLTGCTVGPNTRQFAPATGPQGIEADLRFNSRAGRIVGELLEVQDTALVLLSVNRVILVPIRAIRDGRFARRGTLIANGGTASGGLASLRLMSRFPAGLTPEIRARMLAAYGQTEPDVAP